MNCKNCNKKIEDEEAKFCIYCGTPLKDVSRDLQFFETLYGGLNEDLDPTLKLKLKEILLNEDYDLSWKMNYLLITFRIAQLIKEEGKKIKCINIESLLDSSKQYDIYMKTVENLKSKSEYIVCTRLPGEERIFWPNQDAQFYFKDADQAFHTTGNPQAIQKVKNFMGKKVNTTVPDLEFWKDKNYIYEFDDFTYINHEQRLAGIPQLGPEEVLKKYGHMQTKPFTNKEWWYIIKFFLIASSFENLEAGLPAFLGGVPNIMKIKCECNNLLDIESIIKGFFKIQDYDHEHQYYLYLSKKCSQCGKSICVYRPRGPLFIPLIPYLSFLPLETKYDITDPEMLAAWTQIFKQAVMVNKEKFQKLYSEEIIKFGTYVLKKQGKNVL
ncbi:MAG: hypothetical protein BAJALOKI1v1_870002 [Promethearchaeota archaeon]|nr:MAG: hypothetical protein BAJALOKI1v1_870002 [Candidatus Lokiarchaeota archaeon]